MKKEVNIANTINEIAAEVNSVLNNREKDKYFQEIVLLYSFIENLLKWLVWMKSMWERDEPFGVDVMSKMRTFYRGVSFYEALNIAFSINLIDLKLFEKIDTIRKERNNVIHQLWIYGERNRLLLLRKRLERLARVANDLVGISNELINEIGVDNVYRMTL